MTTKIGSIAELLSLLSYPTKPDGDNSSVHGRLQELESNFLFNSPPPKKA